MIQLFPFDKQKISCPYCKRIIKVNDSVWNGIHIGLIGECTFCKTKIVQDLSVGHARYYPFSIDISNWRLFGPNNHSRSWFGEPFLKSLKKPINKNIEVKINKRKDKNLVNRKVVIINCLDFLYGHCVLKLFNCNKYKNDEKVYLITIVPHSIEWLVPSYVNEVWVVKLSLVETLQYNIELEKKIKKQLKRFRSFYIDETDCHPKNVDIEDFAKCQPHNLEKKKKEIIISFYWREDRLWLSSVFLNKLFMVKPIKYLFFLTQAVKVIWLFDKIRKQIPNAVFFLVGIGKQVRFPTWINDFRIAKFSQEKDKKMCEIYAKSDLIIGTLGSHMILPSALAGMTIEITQDHLIGCVGQDVVVTPQLRDLDPRLISFLHRYAPIDSSVHALTMMATSMLVDYQYSKMYFPKA